MKERITSIIILWTTCLTLTGCFGLFDSSSDSIMGRYKVLWIDQEQRDVDYSSVYLYCGLQFIDKGQTRVIMMLPLFLMLFCFFSVIPLIIHFNFWSLDKHLLLVIEGHYLSVKNKRTGYTVHIDYRDIDEIEITTCSSSKAFWGMNEYFKILTKHNTYLHLTNYLIEPLKLQEKLQSEVKFSCRNLCP